MSKQISILADEPDIAAIVGVADLAGDLQLLERCSVGLVFVTWLARDGPIPEDQFFTWKPSLPEGLEGWEIDGRRCLDGARSAVIEVDLPSFRFGQWRPGRLYLASSRAGDGAVAKSAELVGWYDSIARWVRRHFRRADAVWIGPSFATTAESRPEL